MHERSDEWRNHTPAQNSIKRVRSGASYKVCVQHSDRVFLAVRVWKTRTSISPLLLSYQVPVINQDLQPRLLHSYYNFYIYTNTDTIEIYRKMFTSRLPISTSVRRPTNDMSRASNIPVTVKKTNLFTPQTKRPFSLGASTAGKSFTSGTATERKFQRSLKPAPDRDAQQRMFDTLVEFLRCHAPGFPVPDAKKFFSSVSTTESSRIFEFLIGSLLPDFKITRLEIDVPEALSTLDYPYIRSVTKSSLVSVTTRQAAAGLLHIFDWLVEAIQVQEGDESLDADEAHTDQQVALANAMLYPDTVYEENRKYLRKKFGQEDNSRLSRELELADEELDRLQRQLQENDALTQDEHIVSDDIKTCHNYRSEMQQYLQTKILEAEETNQKYRDLDLRLEEQIRHIDRLKHETSNHRLDVDQVSREREIQSKLEQTLQAFQDQKAQADAELKLVDSRDQKLRERSLEWSSERSKQLRDYVGFIASIPYLASINLELPQNLDTEEDVRTCISRLKEIQVQVDAILLSKKTYKMAEAKQLERSLSEYTTEIMPRLQEEHERTEKMLEVARRNYDDNAASNKSRMDNLALQATQQEKELIEKVKFAREKRDREVHLHEEEKRKYGDLQQSSRGILESHLENLKRSIGKIVNESKQEAQDWKDSEAVWEKTRVTVDRAYTLLKRPLNLP